MKTRKRGKLESHGWRVGSLDLLLRALFALGATPRDIAKALQAA